MPSVLCETSSRVHLKFKPSSSFNIEDIVKNSLPDGSIILKNHNQRIQKKGRSQEMFFAIAQFAYKTLPAVGMLNTQNNCYINASLQVLLRMPVFGATISKIEHSNCKLPFCMINFLKTVITKLSRGERVALSVLLENIRAINKDFRRGQQEDAHEMILGTLEYIRSELRGGHRSNGAPEQDAWGIKTIDSTLFTKFRQSIRCFSCGNISVTNTSDAFVVVGCGASLVMALKEHFGTEMLEGDCAYHCDKCRGKVRATKRLAIDEPGEYFAVQLSRFHYDGYKNSNFVPFPETINLTEFTENPKGPPNEYTLFATIIHEGDTTRSGHYLSIVKENNKYTIFNDLDVEFTTWREVQHTKPYIIIYAKVHRLMCNANVLKRKLDVRNGVDEPAVKKPLNSYNIYSIKTVDNRPLGSAAVAVTTCANNVKDEAIRDERGRVSSAPRAGPKLVWHRQGPASAAAAPPRNGATEPRKAQVILSQQPHEEIQNIAPKLVLTETSSGPRGPGQAVIRTYRAMVPRPVERSSKAEHARLPQARPVVQKVVRNDGFDSNRRLIVRPPQKRQSDKDIENRPHSLHVHQNSFYSQHHKASNSFREPQYVVKHNTSNNYKSTVHSSPHHYNNFSNNSFTHVGGTKSNKSSYTNGHHHNGYYSHKFNGNYKGNYEHHHHHHNHFNQQHHNGFKESDHNARHYHNHHNHYNNHHNGSHKHFPKNYQRKRP